MQLSAVLTKDDLAALVGEIAPLEIELSRKPRRVVSVGKPSLVELVAEEGLRLRGDARFLWDALGLTFPVTVRTWQVLLAPRVVVIDGAHALAFQPTLEAIDLSNVPGFVEGAIMQAARGALDAYEKRLVWRFGTQLAVHLPLPQRVSPASRFDLAPVAGEAVVTAEEMKLTLRFEAHVARLAQLAPESRRSA